MRTFRTRTTTAAAATALLAALSLTACQNGGGSDAASSTAPSAASSAAPSSPAVEAPAHSASPADAKGGDSAGSGTGPETDTDDSGTRGTKVEPVSSAGKGGASTGKGGASTGKGGASTGRGGAPAFATCTGDNTRVTVSRPPRPINHLLITATNTGSRTCLAYSAPLLDFDDSQAALPVIESSRPQAVVTLAPGQSAYASVLLSGERAPEEANGRVVERLTVWLASRGGAGSVGTPARLKLPADTHVTDDAAVSYWQATMEDALTY
ncbi:DUF4232 domain-containing protein [Streptomyces sp. Act-28]